MQATLFDERTAGRIDLPGADLLLVPGLFGEDECRRLFGALYQGCAWRQESVHMYGREVLVPRLTAWYGGRRTPYTYSGLRMEPTPWAAPLLEVKAAVEEACALEFNSALANLYRNGRDSVAWHSDDETELGPEPAIASVSFGATRTFNLRRTDDHGVRHDIPMTPGTLLVMAGRTQHNWQHRIAKTSKPLGPRINLTFRHTFAS